MQSVRAKWSDHKQTRRTTQKHVDVEHQDATVI